MLILVEILASLLAAALLFFPVITLPYMLFKGSLFEDTAYLLVYIAVGAMAGIAWTYGRHLWRQSPTWSHAFLFFGAVLAAAAISTVSVFLLAALFRFDAVDSGHGGSVILAAMAALGTAVAGAVAFTERRRRAL